jgi:putative inorganic carbon (hco3(-)) transporter
LVLFAVLFVRRFIYDSGADNLSLSLRGRLEFWGTALRMIADRPLKFTGLGGFGNFYRMYVPHARFESMMAHNIIMQLWIETGLYGLLVFVWFVSALFHNGFKVLLKKRACFEAYVFQAGVLSAVSAFLLHNMFDFSFFVAQASIVWWILCAFTLNDS